MKVLCIGDSHTSYFGLTGYHYKTFGRPASPKLVHVAMPASSAAGFGKGEEGQSAYLRATKNATGLDYDQICFNLGQVDAEAGAYYGRHVLDRDESDEAYFTRVYSAYLEQCYNFADGKPFVVKGLNTSCLIDDHSAFVHVFNMITRRITDQSERERISEKLKTAHLTVASHAKRNCIGNEVLRSLAAKRSIRNFDIRPDIESSETPGLTDVAYLEHNANIHLVRSYYILKVHYQRLMETILD